VAVRASVDVAAPVVERLIRDLLQLLDVVQEGFEQPARGPADTNGWDLSGGTVPTAHSTIQVDIKH
jgi:hypothetical protein